ncbi:MAG: YceI family protein, partial [Flavitalea sp.]
MKSLMIMALCAMMAHGYAQTKFFTRSGKISFFSRSLIENIEAVNKSVTCVIDISTGNIQSVLKMKGFGFRKSLMQEHFNENYVESDKYPQAEFKGKITNN